MKVRGTVSVSEGGKVNLVLEGDVLQSPQPQAPDMPMTVLTTNNIRDMTKDKINSGTIAVHETCQPITDRDLSTMIYHAQGKQKFRVTRATALMRAKRTVKPTTSTSTLPTQAIEDIKPTEAVEDIKADTKVIENIEAVESTGGKPIEHDKDLTDEKHHISDKDSLDDSSSKQTTSDKDSSDDSSSDSESSDSPSASMPQYTTWSSDWHDTYASLLLMAEEYSANPRRRKIMNDLLGAVRQAKSLLDKSDE